MRKHWFKSSIVLGNLCDGHFATHCKFSCSFPFSLALLMIPVVYMIKRTTQRIYPDPQLVEDSKVYPERPISVRHGEIRA